MPAQLQPNRLVVNDRFPMLGFTIRTDGTPQQAEITIATNPSLFDDPARRTSSNFFSSSEFGPLSVPKGETVYIVPLEILARFAGSQRLYFGLATAPTNNGANDAALQIQIKPTDDSPYVSISGLSGRGLRQVRLFPRRNQHIPQNTNGGNDYGEHNGHHLRWAGDIPKPGMQRVTPNTANDSQNVNSSNTHDNDNNDNSSNTSEPIDYDDGFGPMPSIPTADNTSESPHHAPQQTIPASQAFNLDFTNIQLNETVAAQPPVVTRLSSAESINVQAALALNPTLIPLVAVARSAAELGNVAVSIGPASSTDLMNGTQLGTGLIFAPGNRMAIYSSAETITGMSLEGVIASIGVTAQITVLRNGIESFEGISYRAGFHVGEGVVADGSVIFDAQQRFLGVSFNLGVSLSISPFEIFIGIQRSIASQLGYTTAFSVNLGDIQIGETTTTHAPSVTTLSTAQSLAIEAALASNPALLPLGACPRTENKSM